MTTIGSPKKRASSPSKTTGQWVLFFYLLIALVIIVSTIVGINLWALVPIL